MDGRHEMYARSNFHAAAAAAAAAAEHVPPPPPPTNGTSQFNVNGNGCNGSSAVNGTARYNQHVSPISRTPNSQTDHHRHQPHPGKLIPSSLNLSRIERMPEHFTKLYWIFCWVFLYCSIITSSCSSTTAAF